MTPPSRTIPRPPVVVVLGHVDHGKSSLLDYIRKSNVVAGEAGGITQHTAAYEVTRADAEGIERRITFIDTPGHEAFGAQRRRGALLADIAVLVVSAEDGVKTQTKEALAAILDAKIPYVVAINKIDLPNADLERTLGSLAENEIYVEGRGGAIPYVPISAKTGEGIENLLEVVLLLAEVEQFTGTPDVPAEGIIVESHRDPKRGISATFIIRSGTLKTGMAVASAGSFAPVRSILSANGDTLSEATMCTPVTIIGWSTIPEVGAKVVSFEKKKDAECYADENCKIEKRAEPAMESAAEDSAVALIPIIIKADVTGSIDAIRHEIGKIQTERVLLKVLHADVGAIGEGDVKRAGGDARTVIIGFNTMLEPGVREIAERTGVAIHTESIIYKLHEWLEALAVERRPKQTIEEVHGRAKILKIFSKIKSKQVIGARVEEGVIGLGNTVTVLRRDEPIGNGKIVELQKERNTIKEAEKGAEFGAKIDAHVDIAPGDHIAAYTTVIR